MFSLWSGECPGGELSYCGQVPINRLGTDKIGTDGIEVSSCSEVEGKEQVFPSLEKGTGVSKSTEGNVLW